MRVTTVGVQSGAGLVGRFGAAVVVVADAGPDDAFTAGLLKALETSAADDVAWAVVGLLTPTSPACAIATERSDGWHLLLHGAAYATVDGRSCAGTDALTWVDLVVGDARLIALSLSEGDVVPDPRSSLKDGVVGGGGVLVTPGIPEPPPAPEQPASRDTADLAPVSEPEETGAAHTMVVRLDTLGALVADDGTRTILDRTYVLGREPSQSAEVQRGEATPIVVDDPDNLVSRVQVRVSVENGAVLVHDTGSANGTFVAAPGAPDWDRIGDTPVVLPPGWSLRMGKRVFTHVVGQTS